MQEHERKIRPALAAIVLVCFFMPFLKVSCGGQQIMAVTGLDLATGKEVQPADPFAGMPQADAYRTNAVSSATPPDSVWGEIPADEATSMGELGGMGNMDGKVTAEPSAAAAIALALVALLASLAASRRAMQVSGITAGLCAICLFILKSSAGGDIPPEAAAIIAIEWTTQFWIALLGSAALAAFTFHLLTQKEPENKPKLVIQTYQEKVPQ